MRSLMTALNDAIRSLRRHPAVALGAMLVLTPALVAHGLAFALFSGHLLRPLPFDESQSLVMMGETHGTAYSGPVHYATFLAWRNATTQLEGLAAHRMGFVYVTTDTLSMRAPVAHVSAGLFATLRTPLTGREFSAREDTFGAPPTAMISHELWMNAFNGDRAVLGRTIAINGRPATIVGITPAGFSFWRRAEVFLPLGREESAVACSVCGNLYVLGRLRPGVTFQQATTEMDAIEARLRPALSGYSVAVRRYREFVTAGQRPFVTFLLAGTALVLLIASANVGNLLRPAVLAREILPVFAAAALLAIGIITFVARLSAGTPHGPSWWPQAGITADWRVFTYTIVLAALSYAGTAALLARRADPAPARPLHASGSRPFTSALAIVQLAVAVVVSVHAGLAVSARSYAGRQLPASDGSDVITMRLGYLPLGPGDARSRVLQSRQGVLDDVAGLPGVTGVSGGKYFPPETHETCRVTPVDSVAAVPFVASLQTADAGYLRTFGVTMAAGAWLTTDRQINEGVVVDENAVKRYWNGRSPLGDQLYLQSNDPSQPTWRRIYTVTGVARATSGPGASVGSAPTVYVPYGGLDGLARVDVAPGQLSDIIRSRLLEHDARIVVFDARTMGQALEQARVAGMARLSALVLAALLALAFACVALSAASAAVGASAAGSRTPLERGLVRIALGLSVGIAATFVQPSFAADLGHAGVPAWGSLGIVVLLLAGAAAFAWHLPWRHARRQAALSIAVAAVRL